MKENIKICLNYFSAKSHQWYMDSYPVQQREKWRAFESFRASELSSRIAWCEWWARQEAYSDSSARCLCSADDTFHNTCQQWNIKILSINTKGQVELLFYHYCYYYYYYNSPGILIKGLWHASKSSQTLLKANAGSARSVPIASRTGCLQSLYLSKITLVVGEFPDEESFSVQRGDGWDWWVAAVLPVNHNQ